MTYSDNLTKAMAEALKIMHKHKFHTSNKDTFEDDYERYSEDVWAELGELGTKLDIKEEDTLENFIYENLAMSDNGERYYSFRKVKA